jgi:hypothetical protein|nr:MAG TPA: Protein of unknown function (DUF2497) [Caudoviricetes sp.]
MADEPCTKSIDWLYNWCAGLIPSVYDESLSYYEQIAKVLSVLEEVIKHLGETDANAEELKRLYYSLKEQFDEFVDGGFEEYYEALLRAWIDENAPSIVKDMLLTGVFFGLTSDGYFCAYKPSTWEDVQFDTGAIYGTEEYGRLILRYDVNGQGVINNTGYDASVMSDTIDSRLKAIAGKGLEYDDKAATLNVKTLKGKGEVALHDGVTSTNPGVLLSLTNELQFLGDYVVGEDGFFGVLPEGYRPKSITPFRVLATLGEITKTTDVFIDANGIVKCNKGGVTVHTTGIVVNLPGDWY